ncbi:putative bifunctional SAT/APS kinase [Nocardioides aquaticus]|uniref:Adenylyl-sulfate kinase n=1 Tax=Nocardioides aquaticus TaxID=160826 RepID=A0ABX8EEW3_9ACTN|nr:adenylyl-sulfate kinase [Nocardioides aquaticus]QVT78430.1 putative bifunctional SAT/APS kinase [Nocardioides aquaticus]
MPEPTAAPAPSPGPAPQHCPTPRELDDLELLVTGALAPLRGFDEPGSPVSLALPADLADADVVELVDPEGLPLARATRGPAGSRVVEPLSRSEYGPFRRLHLSPVEVRAQHAGRTVVPVSDALTVEQAAELRALGPVLLLTLCGTGLSALSPVALVRATLTAAEDLDAVVVAVPLASHGDAETDHRLGVQVAATYAGDDPVHGLRADGEPDARVAAIVEQDQPAPDEQGLVLFFTGLSGSGKSTLARALMDRLLEAGSRSVTSLDGDVVRRHLSAGLTFSKADRETNIRRIGWVAAEISRHGGVAVCSPIAPFDETRQQVRAMVDEARGAFFLVHVATPLEECERRDRKGLYAKARRGEIPEFTGISSPYEEPEDADVRVDTTGRTIEAALDDVLDALDEAGLIPRTPEVEEPRNEESRDHTPPVVEERVQRASRDQAPLNVLFVCTANICRSPYMELRARQLAGDSATVRFTSAGTHGFDQHPMDPEMATGLIAHGVDPAGFTSRPVSRQLVAAADLVLTAEAAHRTILLEDDPGGFRKIYTLGQFVEGVRRLPEDVRGRDLIEQVGRHRGNADPALDVQDPYRRGPEAAAAASAHLDELLAAAVDRLV